MHQTRAFKVLQFDQTLSFRGARLIFVGGPQPLAQPFLRLPVRLKTRLSPRLSPLRSPIRIPLHTKILSTSSTRSVTPPHIAQNRTQHEPLVPHFNQMDLQTLSNLFATTFNPDPNVQKAGELEIRKVRVARKKSRYLAGSHITSLVAPFATDFRRSASRKDLLQPSSNSLRSS